MHPNIYLNIKVKKLPDTGQVHGLWESKIIPKLN